MLSRKDFIRQAYYFEEQVLGLLKSVCPEMLSCEEYLRRYNVNAQSCLADAYLPDSSIFFKDGGACFVEVKTQLRSDTLYRLREQYSRVVDVYHCEKLVLIYDKALIPIPESKILKILSKQNIKIFSFNDLLELLSENRDEDILSQEPVGISNESRLNILRNTFRKGHVTLFLGAGVGKSAGMPNWTELLVAVLKSSKDPRIVDYVRQYKKLEKDCMYSYPVVGRFAVDGLAPNDFGGSASEMYDKTIDILRDKIKKRLYSKPHHSLLVDALAQLVQSSNVDSVITYNYDDLLENKLRENPDFKFMSVYENNRCLIQEKPIYHVHGYVPRDKYIQSKPVLSERDYHELYKEAYHWTNVEQLHALNRNTCIFVGLSMTDPNLRRLLDFSRGALIDDEKENPHYVFMWKNSSQNEEEKKNAYFNWFENIMHEFGITVIWYNDHNDLPGMLSSLL